MAKVIKHLISKKKPTMMGADRYSSHHMATDKTIEIESKLKTYAAFCN